MEWKQRSLAGVIVIVAGVLAGCKSSAMQLRDPYAKNPEEYDPRARVLIKRDEPAPSPEQVAAEFKALKRPIIERYIKYSGATRAEARHSVNLNYTHIVLTDEACAFITRHTFDELALGLGPMVRDPYWNGDVVAVICVAANYHLFLGNELAASVYHSPEDPGTWAGHVPDRYYFLHISLDAGCFFSTLRVDLHDGTIIKKTQQEMQEEYHHLQVWRRHRPVPAE